MEQCRIRAEDVPVEEVRKQFEVNLFGLSSITQKVVPYMRKAKKGLIINTSSMGDKMYTPMGAWYHASKHALEGFSDCLRLELDQFNIKVVILEPGVIQTEFGEVMLNNLSKFLGNSIYSNITNKLINATKKLYANGGATNPDVIANTIVNIVTTKSPKTRYRIGKFSKPMVWLRTYLGDRIFDKIVMSQV